MLLFKNKSQKMNADLKEPKIIANRLQELTLFLKHLQ